MELLNKQQGVTAEDLAGVYKEIAEIVGLENAYKIFHNFKGLQLMFPLKFYSSAYKAQQIIEEYDGNNVRNLAKKYEYSESRIRQILRSKKSDYNNEQ